MTLKRTLKEASFRVFLIFEKLGVHVLPKHYYSPVADYDWLSQNKPAWARRVHMAGTRWELEEQLDWLEGVCGPYHSEVAGFHSYNEIMASGIGRGYGPIESQILHCFIRSADPANVVEIGSGVTTAIMLRAADLNAREGRQRPRITCIEPYPKKALRDAEGISLIEEMCQVVPFDVFSTLGEGDLLFIDSSHALKPGSDVLRIYLDILPRLKAGVTIHIHDIYLPYLFSPNLLSDFWGWQETPLLLALMMNNERLSVLSCLSALHDDRPGDLARVLPDYRPIPLRDGLFPSPKPEGHYPSSIWLRTC